MKNQTIAVILLGVLAVFIGVYLLIGNKSIESVRNGEDASIQLYVEEGDVSYKTESMESFQKATSSFVLISNNTNIHTGLGRATVLFPNNSSVTLDHYTELVVKYDGDKVSLFQTLGATYHRVEALVTGGSYEIETPGTLAAVRGTKFAVKYDKKTKATKVAVTESKVEVSKFKEEEFGTTMKKILTKTLLEEGKTALIDVRSTSSAQVGVGDILIVETEKDVDMRTWVDVNKEKDSVIEVLRQTEMSKEEMRNELKSLLRGEKEWNEERYSSDEAFKQDTERGEKKTEEVSESNKERDTSSDKKIEEQKKEEIKERRVEEKKEETKRDELVKETKVEEKKSTGGVAVKKINEEEFFDKFNMMFFNYFYIDENDSPCKIPLSASERVRLVTTYALESGYSFSSRTLLDFAQNVDAYCTKKDASVKVKLQSRFDAEFPYQD